MENKDVMVCPDCAGSGIRATFFEHEYTCTTCRGHGQLPVLGLKDIETAIDSKNVQVDASWLATELLRRYKKALALLKVLNDGLHEHELAGYFTREQILQLDDLIRKEL